MSTLEIEAILSQDDWLRRMARILVQDPNAAEDLAQEAWLADLQGGGAARDKRSWLSVVLFRAEAKSFRSERSQRERAESAAHLRASEAPAAGEVASKKQLRVLVAEELLALPEPQRTALHLVYVADLSVSEAARHMGVAKSTASERVKRGLEMMRERIDGAYDGDRSAWCIALLPWASLRSSAKGTPVRRFFTANGWKSFATMGAVIAVSMLAVGWAYRSSLTSSTTSKVLVEAPMMDASSNPGTVLAKPEPDSIMATVIAPDTESLSDRTARISASFVDDQGNAVPGIRWSLDARSKATAALGAPQQSPGAHPEEPVEWEDLSGELGADGILDLLFEVPLHHAFYLSVEAQGYAKMSWVFRRIERGSDKQLGKLKLQSGLTLRGRVASPIGDPLNDRVWTVRARTTRVDAMLERTATWVSTTVPVGQLTFELAGLPAGDVQVFLQSGNRRIKEPQLVRLPAMDTVPHTFTVDLSQAVSSSAQFHLNPRLGILNPPLSLTAIEAAAADGRVLEVVAVNALMGQFEVLDATLAPFQLSISDPRFEPWSAEIANPGSMTRVSLKGSASLELGVRDAQGNTVDRYAVALLSAPQQGMFSSNEKLMHDGEDALPGGMLEHVVPGSYRLIVRSDEGVSETELDDLQPGERRLSSITLGTKVQLAGSVRYPDGEPATGVEVHLVRPAAFNDSGSSLLALGLGSGYGGEEWRISVAQTLSGEEGEFELERPDAESYYVVASRPNRTWVISDLRAPESRGDPVDLVLSRGSTLEGAIELPAHLPKDGWAVLLGITDPRMAESARWQAPELDLDGKFSVEGIPAGVTRVALTRERASSWTDAGGVTETGFLIGTVDLQEGELHQETFNFVNGVPVDVTAELPQGQEGSFSVSFYRTDGDNARERGQLNGPMDRLGSCLLEPGTYVAAVIQGNAAVLNGPNFFVPTTSTHTVHLDWALTEKRIRVFGKGAPLANQSVGFSSESGAKVRFRTGGDGWMTIRLDSGPLKARWRMEEADLVWPPTADELHLD